MSAGHRWFGVAVLVAAAGCASGGPFGPVDFSALGPVPAPNETDAVALERALSIDLVREGEDGDRLAATVTERLRLRITRDGAQHFSTYEVASTPIARVAALIARRSRSAGGEVVAEAPRDEAGRLISPAAVNLGNLLSGDVIDLLVRRHYPDVKAAPAWTFSTEAPVVVSQIHVSAPESVHLEFAVGHGKDLVRSPRVRQTGSHSWLFEERDVPAVTRGLRSISPQQNAPWLVFSVAVADGDSAPSVTWGDIAADVLARLASTMELSASFREALPPGLPPARLRPVRAMFRATNRESHDLFGKPPRTFEQLGQDDVTPLELAAVAAAAGRSEYAETYVALIVPFGGPILVEQRPGLYPFRYAAVAYQEDGTWRFVDPACSTCAFGQVSTSMAGGRALVLAPEPVILDVPLGAIEHNTERLQYSWTMNVQGELSGTVIVDLQGLPARSAASLVDGDPNEQRQGAATWLGLEEVTVASVEERSPLTDEGPYQLNCTLQTNLQVPADAPAAFTVTGVGLAGPALRWEMPVGHQGGIRIPAPARSAITATVQLPAGFDMSLPEAVVVENRFGKYSARFELAGGVLTYTRRVGLFAHVVERADIGDLEKFVTSVREADAVRFTFYAE